MQNLEFNLTGLVERIKNLGNIILGLGIVLGVFVALGSVSASTTEELQPASTITYNEELVVNHTGRFNSVYIGKQGTGGVTFFNGTIVNKTTGANNYDNPVTFGDNVRIDGRIWRGATSGSGDSKPVTVLDDVEIQGNLTVSGTLQATHNHDDLYYTETEIDNLAVGFAPTSHSHDDQYYTETEIDTSLAGKSNTGHNHIGETWTGSVTATVTNPAMLYLNNSGNSYGLVVNNSSNFTAIGGTTSGTSAAINGTNTGSGNGVTGNSNTGNGVYATSSTGYGLYINSRLGINAGANKAVGTGTITATATGESINNSYVTENSVILVQIGYGGGDSQFNNSEGLRVDNVASGSFDVYVNSGVAADVDIPFSYLIIN